MGRYTGPTTKLSRREGQELFLKGDRSFSDKAARRLNVKPGQAVSNGDALRVGEGSFAVVIYLDDKSVIKVRENTDFQFIDSQNTRVIRVEQGTTLHNVTTEGRNKPYRVETPVSVASVKGTEFSASHDPVAGVDLFVGKSGNFDVFNTISCLLYTSDAADE